MVEGLDSHKEFTETRGKRLDRGKFSEGGGESEEYSLLERPLGGR
jgi:hypothetical protein